VSLPNLPPDQVAVLVTVDDEGPVAIPVSALVRVDSSTLLLALARRRASLTRARRDQRAAISLSGPGFSVCARGEIDVVADPLPGADFMAGLRFATTSAWDARGPATEVDSGIDWHWTDEVAQTRHTQVLAALALLSRQDPSSAHRWPERRE
jgi:hypothetical protein